MSKDSESIDEDNSSTYVNFIPKKVPSLGNLGLLFCCFMMVSSDVFNNNILSIFDGAMTGRDLTFYGAIIQGISLIFIYAVLCMYV